MTDDHVDADSGLGFEPAVADHKREPAAPAREAGGRKRGGFRRRLTSVAVLFSALTIVGGAYAMFAPSSGADSSGDSAQAVMAGRALYETSCITCHGANLQGVTGRGPSLIGVGSAATYFQVSTGRMPASQQGPYTERKPAHFTDEQTRDLAAYVESKGGGPKVPDASQNLQDGSMSDGGELFRLNCASCHGSTAAGAPLSAGKVAPGLHEATDAQIYTAMLSGPENMPVFSDNQLTPEQKRSIVAYLHFLNHSQDAGGASLAKLGPVTEGLLLWTAGLGVLIVAILWIGARS